MNADSGNASKCGGGGGTAVLQREAPRLTASVLRAAAAVLPEGAVVDTTGAWDSFIGTVVYGLATGLSNAKILQVGASYPWPLYKPDYADEMGRCNSGVRRRYTHKT